MAICHTIVKGTVDKLQDGPLKDSITRHAQEYNKQMNNLLNKSLEPMIGGTFKVHLFVSHIAALFPKKNILLHAFITYCKFFL